MDPTTGICVDQCPTTPNLFGNPVTDLCVKECFNDSNTAYFADSTDRKCSTTCSNNQFYQFSPNLCVVICSRILNLYGDPADRKCVP